MQSALLGPQVFTSSDSSNQWKSIHQLVEYREYETPHIERTNYIHYITTFSIRDLRMGRFGYERVGKVTLEPIPWIPRNNNIRIRRERHIIIVIYR